MCQYNATVLRTPVWINPVYGKDTRRSFHLHARFILLALSRKRDYAIKPCRPNFLLSCARTEEKLRVSRVHPRVSSERIALNPRASRSRLRDTAWRGIPFICFQVTGHTRCTWAYICRGRGDIVGISTIIHNGSRTLVKRMPTTRDQVSWFFVSLSRRCCARLFSIMMYNAIQSYFDSIRTPFEEITKCRVNDGCCNIHADGVVLR